MANIAVLGTPTFNTNSGTKTVTATPAVGDLIIIVSAHTGNVSAATPTDDQGGTYTLLQGSVKNTNADRMAAYVRDTLIEAAVSTVFTIAPGASSGGGLVILAATGMSRAGADAEIQSSVQNNQGAGGTPTPVFADTPSIFSIIVGAVFNSSSPAGMTPRASYAEEADIGYATPTTGLEVMTLDAGETATSIAWGGTSATEFCSLVVELRAPYLPQVMIF